MDEMEGWFHETKFQDRMYPLVENKEITIFRSDVDTKDAPISIVITIVGRKYLLYYDGRNYVCLYEEKTKYGWKIDLNEREPFRVLDNVASEFQCIKRSQY